MYHVGVRALSVWWLVCIVVGVCMHVPIACVLVCYLACVLRNLCVARCAYWSMRNGMCVMRLITAYGYPTIN
jgi:hypothetical protein